jgi:predicted transcriptional regulator
MAVEEQLSRPVSKLRPTSARTRGLQAEPVRTVGEAAVRNAKICEPDVSVAEVRRLFLDDHVHMALLVDRGHLVTTIDRDDVPQHVPGDTSARGFGRLTGRTIGAEVSLRRALLGMRRGSRRRLAVIGHEGSFLGLLCLKRTGDGFCTDADVRARAAARRQDHRRPPRSGE